MPEWFFSLLVSYPTAFNWIGRAVFTLVGMLAVLGARLDRIGARIASISAQVGVAAPDFLMGLPWWLRMVVPETTSGWIGLGILALLGVWLAYLGKWAETANLNAK
ncbi:hypothetical protein D3C86_1674070 [compost metagenome]